MPIGKRLAKQQPPIYEMTSMAFGDVFKSKTVWISGTTGFKGAWLAQWLVDLGAKVHGYALNPPTTPSLFEQINLEKSIAQEIADLNDARAVQKSIDSVQPDFIFHLAAQSLVRYSYQEPQLTFATNVLGTINVLEAARKLTKPAVAICITTDKCYENREWLHSYREEDPLGGYDPYSASKACAEIAIASYRRSFFKNHPVKIASVRAGNVIGGGDWALDRIVPDCIRALQKGEPIPVRNKTATRPWQHVLEPLSAYLWLAAILAHPTLSPYPTDQFQTAFNIGPNLDSNRTVADLVTELLKHWPGKWEDRSDPNAPHEASKLNLAIDKAHHLLGWQPTWPFQKTIAETIAWYRQPQAQQRAYTTTQIQSYTMAAKERGLPWTT